MVSCRFGEAGEALQVRDSPGRDWHGRPGGAGIGAVRTGLVWQAGQVKVR